MSNVSYIVYENNGEIEVNYDDDYTSSSFYYPYFPVFYEAYLFYSEEGLSPRFTTSSIAEIYDSLNLGNDWYFVVTRCDGCGV